MKIRSVFLAVIAFSFCSCGAGGGEGNGGDSKATEAATTTAAPAYDSSLAPGKIMENVTCRNQATLSYALYLPSYYTSKDKFPCLFYFDSHGHGDLPVRSYKDLAEKYGFVLVGSNNSKNGMQWGANNDMIKVMMADAESRIHTDSKRIYTGGFSGGSRVAGSVAIFDGGVAGVIGCAVGFPEVDHDIQNKFDYFGMVGVYDFNLQDMAMQDDALEKNGFPHQLLTFEGKHEWPPAADMETALLWLQVCSMKKNGQPKNDTLIAALKDDYNKLMKAGERSGNKVKAYQLLRGMVQALDGLTNIGDGKKQLTTLAAGTGLKNALAANAQEQQEELALRQGLVRDFTTHDEQWWAKKIHESEQLIRTTRSLEEAQMQRRLLNYLGFVGYMNSSRALGTGDLDHAMTYLDIFKMADPKNPDCSYLMALYYMKKGDTKQALASLNDAAALGFSDVTQLLNDPAFAGILGDAGFQKVVSLVTENRKKGGNF